MAAMLVYRNNKIYLLWEMQIKEEIFFYFVHQHGGNSNLLFALYVNYHYKQYDILRRVDPLSFGGKECMPA